MLRDDRGLFLTATDVVNHLGCAHLTPLELQNLVEPLPAAEHAMLDRRILAAKYGHLASKA